MVGGVSSWCQMLIQGLPEHEFFIYSIGAEAKNRGDFKYKLPANVVGVQEEFLDDILSLKSKGMRENILNAAERKLLYELVTGSKPINVQELSVIFRDRGRFQSPLDIFMSSDFFDVIQRVYEENYPYLPFTDFFWTLRSMLLPLFFLLQQDLPAADVEGVAAQIINLLGCKREDIVGVSAKTGLNVEKVLDEIIEKGPAPKK